MNAWPIFVYGVVAPFVALLLALRHPRARFSAYLFLSFESLRGLSSGGYVAAALALSGIAFFQLPAVRRVYPRIDPRRFLSARAARGSALPPRSV